MFFNNCNNCHNCCTRCTVMRECEHREPHCCKRPCCECKRPCCECNKRPACPCRNARPQCGMVCKTECKCVNRNYADNGFGGYENDNGFGFDGGYGDN